MGSRMETEPMSRFLQDAESERSIARLYSPTISIPRRPPSLTRPDDYDIFASAARGGFALLALGEQPEYAMSSTVSRPQSVYSDDDSLASPVDFMSPPRRAEVAPRVTGPSARSGNTAPPPANPAPSTCSSEASSFSSSNLTRSSVRTTTSTQESSLPSPRPEITNFLQTLAAEAGQAYVPASAIPPGSHPLWCELCVVGDCSVTFRIDQTRAWIDHHSEHLRDRYPTRLVCWFCDHVRFATRGRTNQERYANFRDRMEHIRQHIFDDELTSDDMRPDFSMINWLADQGIIEDHMRNLALGISELPEPLRLPGGSSSASGSAQSSATQRLPPWLAHDIDREERHRRRRGG